MLTRRLPMSDLRQVHPTPNPEQPNCLSEKYREKLVKKSARLFVLRHAFYSLVFIPDFSGVEHTLREILAF